MTGKNQDFLQKFLIITICLLYGSLIMMATTVILPDVAGLNIMPNQPFELIIVWLCLCFLCLAFISIFFTLKWKTWIKMVLLLPNMVFLPVILLVSATFINTLVWTESVCTKVYEGIPYAIVVRKDDAAENADDLENYRIEILKDIDEFGIHALLQVKTDWKYTTLVARGGLNQMATDLIDNKTQAIVLRKERLEYLNNRVEGFHDNTKVIYEFGIESKSYKVSDEGSLPDSFAVYINSFASPEGTKALMGESNNNLLMVVNRTQKKVLFVRIPKEYYVQLAGPLNLKDTILSSGLYGIKESVETIEQLYDFDIDFFVSLDMDRMESVIDQLGGITVPTRGGHDAGSQSIEAMIKKMIGTDVLRRNYGEILQAMEDGFQTDMSNNILMNALVYQIIAEHDWQFETVIAEGNSAVLPTADPEENSPIYVLNPDEKSVSEIKEKIKDVMAGS